MRLAVALAGWICFLMTIIAPVAIEDSRPVSRELVRILGDEAHWVCRIDYRPGSSFAAIEIQMDNLGNRQLTDYAIQSTEAWFPQIAGTIAGSVGDFAVVQFGVVTPRPLSEEEAWSIAQSLTVKVTRDGTERTISFTGRYTRGESPSLAQRLKAFWVDQIFEPKTSVR